VFVGPRLFVAGSGLHGLPKIPEMEDKVAEQIKQTKDRLAEGVDWVKVFGSTGGFDKRSEVVQVNNRFTTST
jgi:hypothetical protein